MKKLNLSTAANLYISNRIAYLEREIINIECDLNHRKGELKVIKEIKTKWEAVSKGCKVCGKPAKYEEYSPDGPPHYFCTKEHHKQYTKKMNKKGLFWLAGPLRRI